MGAQSLWIEKVNSSNNADIDYESNYLKKFFNSHVEITAYKFIFVQESNAEIIKVDPQKLTFLSCSVVMNYSSGREKNSYLLYSIVAIPKRYDFLSETPIPLMNYYFHSFRNYDFILNDPLLGKVNFKICGSPFFQQNKTTSVCMQSALATIFNNIGHNKKLILPNRINELYGVPFGRELFLDKKGTLKVIKKRGLFTKELLFDQKETMEVFKELFKKFGWSPSSSVYPWMESGFPGFIVFRTRSTDLHVVPIIGHTLNTDSWQPEADIRYNRRVRFHFRPVSAWIDNFIIHDDNFGMYLSYPASKLSEKKGRYGYFVDHVIFVTEHKITLPPDRLEIDLISDLRQVFELNKDVSEEENPWLHRIINEEKAPLVSRTMVAKKTDFLKTLGQRDSNGKKITKTDIDAVGEQMPDRFWLTEVTLPDLYLANKTALISIVTQLNTDRQIFIRLPRLGYLIIQNKCYRLDLPTSGHYKIYERISDIETYDW
ncbi:MAG: hypothetical protein FJ266_13365 [Planctomycetes bacterium]|nr:hypothetical protein [Planctomycetota bacterium]